AGRHGTAGRLLPAGVRRAPGLGRLPRRHEPRPAGHPPHNHDPRRARRQRLTAGAPTSRPANPVIITTEPDARPITATLGESELHGVSGSCAEAARTS